MLSFENIMVTYGALVLLAFDSRYTYYAALFMLLCELLCFWHGMFFSFKPCSSCALSESRL